MLHAGKQPPIQATVPWAQCSPSALRPFLIIASLILTGLPLLVTRLLMRLSMTAVLMCHGPIEGGRAVAGWTAAAG